MSGYTNGVVQIPTAIPAPPVIESAPSPELGAVLSPSQAKAFIECPARWYFKYLMGMPDPSNSNLALGTAVHAGIGASMRQKIESHRDLDMDSVNDAYHEAWADAAAEATFTDEEKPEEIRALGQALTERYMVEAAPGIQPAAVELNVTGAIAGVKVQGYIDILDTDGRIIDIKTAAKRPSGIGADHRLQLTTYDILAPASRGKARLDTLVKTKTIQYIPQSTEITPADVQYAESVYPMVQESIRDGVFYPRRTSRLCSRKNCPYWRPCVAEFGGEVE